MLLDYKANTLTIVIATLAIALCVANSGYSQKIDLNKSIHKLKDKDPDIRVEAAEALGNTKNPRAVGPLIEALKDKEPRVREAAADALWEKAIGLGGISDPQCR
jgi:HEAT repeat protein